MSSTYEASRRRKYPREHQLCISQKLGQLSHLVRIGIAKLEPSTSHNKDQVNSNKKLLNWKRRNDEWWIMMMRQQLLSLLRAANKFGGSMKRLTVLFVKNVLSKTKARNRGTNGENKWWMTIILTQFDLELQRSRFDFFTKIWD